MCEWDWDRFANEKKVGDCHVNKVSIEASNWNDRQNPSGDKGMEEKKK